MKHAAVQKHEPVPDPLGIGMNLDQVDAIVAPILIEHHFWGPLTSMREAFKAGVLHARSQKKE